MGMPDNKVLDKMNTLVWDSFPQFVYQKISPNWGKAFNDGSFLSKLWRYAFILPPIFFTIGMIIGATHIAFVGQEVFTFSITIMIVMVLPAVFSRCLGLWLCLGYAIGDILIYEFSYYLHQDIPLWGFIEKNMAPRLIPVVFLYFLLVAIPSSGKNLTKKLLSRMAANNPGRKILEPVLTGIWAGIITYGWTKSVPLLIRPVYAWQGYDMPGIVPPLYDSGWIISFIVAMGVMVRQFIDQVFSLSFNPGSSSNDNAGKSMGRLVFLIVGITIFTTFLLSGLYTNWYDALLFGVGVLAATILKLAIMPNQQGWKNSMSRIPFLIRFIVGIIICWLFYNYVAAPNAMQNAEGPQQINFINGVFKNILYTMLVSMMYFVIIFPDTNVTPRSKIATLVLFLVFCGPVAFADNWNNLTNPNDVPPKEIVNDMAKVAIGVTIVGAAVLVAGRRGTDITADFDVKSSSGEPDGVINIQFSGGVGPYTVTGVSPGGNASIQNNGDSSTISNLKPGDYDITFKDSKGDSFTAKATVPKDKEASDSGANAGDSL